MDRDRRVHRPSRIPRLRRTDGSSAETRSERSSRPSESTSSTNHRHVHRNGYDDDSVMVSDSFEFDYAEPEATYGIIDSNGSIPTDEYYTGATWNEGVVSKGRQRANTYSSRHTTNRLATATNGYATDNGYTSESPRYTSPEPAEQYFINWLAPEITVEDIRWACARRVPPIHIRSRVPEHEIKFRYGPILMGLASALPMANGNTDSDSTVVSIHRRRRRRRRNDRHERL